MNINGIIHEQIDWDATIRAFELKENENIGNLWIAFPGDYHGERNGPFYFLDRQYDTIFQNKTAACRHLGIAPENFYREENDYIFKTGWHRIKTAANSLTYYALYLPIFAVPTCVVISDPERPGIEYTRNVFRDDEKNRFVIYIECRSKFALFAFDLMVRFRKDEVNFVTSDYTDPKTVDFYKHLDDWEMLVSQPDRAEINGFFIHNQENHNTYYVGQAGAVGHGASIGGSVINQHVYELPENIDFVKLSEQLIELKKYLESVPESNEQKTALSSLADAEDAANSKDGNKLLKALSATGKWLLEAAKEIGTDVAAEVIKKAMGIKD